MRRALFKKVTFEQRVEGAERGASHVDPSGKCNGSEKGGRLGCSKNTTEARMLDRVRGLMDQIPGTGRALGEVPCFEQRSNMIRFYPPARSTSNSGTSEDTVLITQVRDNGEKWLDSGNILKAFVMDWL